MTMSGGEHRVHRGLVKAAFTRSTWRDLRSLKIEPLARRLVDGFAGRPRWRRHSTYCSNAFPVTFDPR